MIHITALVCCSLMSIGLCAADTKPTAKPNDPNKITLTRHSQPVNSTRGRKKTPVQPVREYEKNVTKNPDKRDYDANVSIGRAQRHSTPPRYVASAFQAPKQ